MTSLTITLDRPIPENAHHVALFPAPPATTPGDARDAAIEECVAECDRIAMDLDSRADALNVQGLTRLAECRAEEAARVRYVRDRIAALSSPPSPSDTPRES